MKKGFAVAMSAVLAAGSTMPAFAESETAFTPSTYVGEFSVTTEGESMLFSIKAEQFAEDGVSLSASVTLPASVTGEAEDTVYGLDDVLRVVSGDLYINVAEVCSVYEELSGSSISSLLSLVGIDQDWVEIPAVDIQAAESDVESEFNADSLTNDLTALMENFNVETAEDGSTTVTFDGLAVVAAVQAVENMYDTVMAELVSGFSTADTTQVTNVFSDYILAAAEGINAVTPDVSIEDAQAQIMSMVDAAVQEIMSSVEVTPLQTEDGQKLSEMLQQSLDEGATINGTVYVGADGTMTENVTVVDGEDTMVLDASFDGTTYTAVVTENGTETATINGVLSAQDNGIGLDLNMTADGQTITANAALAVLDNGLSVSLTANDGTDDVSMAATFTEEDGVTITDTEALQATLLRDVVKNAVTLFYSASQATEEATSAAAE
jgi:hypothetical protein